MLLLQGCATTHPTLQADIEIKPEAQSVPPSTQTKAPTLPEPEVAEASKASVFLEKLTPDDIKKVKMEATRTTLPIWENVNKRSQVVRHRILKVLEELNAPAELLFIPVAESGYNPYALSPTGAFGLWQLMPGTARELGAHHKHGIDGRRDVETSSRAAVQYLLSLHQRFDDWTLAICAYNLGPWGVERRLRKKPWSYEKGLDNLPFPAETRHYVKQILGMIALKQENDLSFSEPLITENIQINAPIDLAQLEATSGLDKNDIFRLNPGLDYQHYVNKDLSIHLPETNINKLKAALQESPDIFKPKFINIKIKEGDSLWTLARRHKTTVKHLKRLNPRLGFTLSIGKSITVPASTNPSAVANKANPLLAKGRRIRYKVRNGDSLWTIAKKFGTSTRSIARTNQISKNQLIRPGDRLWIVARFKAK